MYVQKNTFWFERFNTSYHVQVQWYIHEYIPLYSYSFIQMINKLRITVEIMRFMTA